jgi:hypothetical protein
MRLVSMSNEAAMVQAASLYQREVGGNNVAIQAILTAYTADDIANLIGFTHPFTPVISSG